MKNTTKIIITVLTILLFIGQASATPVTPSNFSASPVITGVNHSWVNGYTLLSSDNFNRIDSELVGGIWSESSTHTNISDNKLRMNVNGAWVIDTTSNSTRSKVCTEINGTIQGILFNRQSTANINAGYLLRLSSTDAKLYYGITTTFGTQIGSTVLGLTHNVTDTICVDDTATISTNLKVTKNGLPWFVINAGNNSYASGFAGLWAGTTNQYYDNWTVNSSWDNTDSYNVSQHNGTWLNGTTEQFYQNNTMTENSWDNISVFAYNITSGVSSGVSHNVKYVTSKPPITKGFSVNYSTNRSYLYLNVTSNRTLKLGYLNFDSSNYSMIIDGETATKELIFLTSINHSFNIILIDELGNSNTSDNFWVNITKPKIIIDTANFSVYANGRTEAPFGAWRATLNSAANTGLLYNYSVCTWGSNPTRMAQSYYGRNMIIQYLLTGTSTYLDGAKNTLIYSDVCSNISDVSGTNAEERWAQTARNYGLTLYWIEGAVNDSIYNAAKDRIAVFANATYMRANEDGVTVVRFVDVHGRLYPDIATTGLTLHDYVNISLVSTPADWISMGTTKFFVNDTLHTLGQPLWKNGIDEHGNYYLGGYRAYTDGQIVNWFNAYGTFYSHHIKDDYPAASMIMNGLIQNYLPNYYTSSYGVLGTEEFYDYARIWMPLADVTQKSKLLGYINTVTSDTYFPDVFSVNTSEGATGGYGLESAYIGYLTYDNYSLVSPATQLLLPYLTDKNSSSSKVNFQKEHGVNSSWLGLVIANYSTTSGRDAAHNDQISIDWYDNGDYLMADGGEPKSIITEAGVNTSLGGYGVFETWHNTISIENPRSPFAKSTWANSSARGIYKGVNWIYSIPTISVRINESDITVLKTQLLLRKNIINILNLNQTISSDILYSRTIIQPDDYFIVFDTLDGSEEWTYRTIFKPSSFNHTLTGSGTNYLDGTNIGKVNVSLYIDNTPYDWESLPYLTVMGGDTLSGLTSSNISWNTISNYGNRIQANLYTVPASPLIIGKSTTTLGGYAKAHEVYSPIIETRNVNVSDIYRITILQSNFSSEVPRTTSNLSVDLNHSGVLVTNSTTRDIITASNSTNGTYSNVTTNADVSFSRKATSLSYISAINVSYFKYDSDVWISSDARLTSIFLNQSGYNRTIIVDGISGTNVTIYATGTNYSVKKNGEIYTDWSIVDSTHLKINMTFNSPATYELLSGGESVSTSSITIPANSWGMFNNWSENTNFSSISSNESNDVTYTFYNVTIGEWDSYYPGYSWNADQTIDKNYSVLGFFNAQTTITATTVTPWNTSITEGWNMLYLMGTTNQTLTAICTDMVNCTDIYYYNSTTNDYVSTGTDTIQPNQGFLAYVNQTGTWIRSTI